MSALAFSVVALLLIGPVPALLARATWTQRAPRAAVVLWQAIALAAVLSAFSAGIAIASRLFVPGPDGRPTATVTSEIKVLGWPLWLLYVVVFALTLLIGVRLIAAWGCGGDHLGRAAEVMSVLASRRVECLRLTAGGHPGHPLYVPRATVPIPFTYRGAPCVP